ncbi:hypothetical protein BHE74_00039967 [Ensete ventricosum]|nr:hypothetical protein GW17_00059039 [Ensete ventricosum]RWW53539.1 hypothetical protein BHE74_00039967 [Ensete ventricosum]RZS15472.1 hypothetical protein BHM03_00047315 [Ensete ventricosum]
MCGSLHMTLHLENKDLSLLDICSVGATFLFAFFPLEVSKTTIPFGLLRLAEQLVSCSVPANALDCNTSPIQSPLHPSSPARSPMFVWRVFQRVLVPL